MLLSSPPAAGWLAASGLVLALPALAQTAPSAGSLLRDVQPPAALVPRTDPSVLPPAPPPRPRMAVPGVRVGVRSLRISGNTVIPEAQLLPLVQDAVGRELGLDGLEDLAARITRYYRQAGYTVAQAYLPQQDITGGVVEIAVVEGRYSAITVKGGDKTQRARLPLSALRMGDVVADRPLEQTLLMLNDLPGLSVRSTLQPGDSIGTTELVIDLEPGPTVTGSVEADNSGGRATGRWRVGGGLSLTNAAGLGDQLSLRALTAGKGLAFGRLGWQAPVGTSGARAGVAVSRMGYQLGGEFAALDASGTADTLGLSASYPVLRSRGNNLSLQAALDAKRLRDEVGSASFSSRKRATVLTLGVTADRSDGFAGGGFTAYSVNLTAGRLRLEGDARAADAASAQTDGRYAKLNLGVQRLQSINGQTSLLLSFNAQWAGKNLDSSEKMGLGGPAAVRAYPPGEASSDEAQLITLELRRALDARWQATAFIDAGHGKANKQAWAAATGAPTRTLRGAGFGLNWNHESGWSLRASYALRLGHEPATAEPSGSGRFWLQASKSF